MQQGGGGWCSREVREVEDLNPDNVSSPSAPLSFGGFGALATGYYYNPGSRGGYLGWNPPDVPTGGKGLQSPDFKCLPPNQRAALFADFLESFHGISPSTTAFYYHWKRGGDAAPPVATAFSPLYMQFYECYEERK